MAMNNQNKRGDGKDGIHWVETGAVPGRTGLVALNGLDSGGNPIRRLAADVRGGLTWPFPMQVGTQMEAAGCAVAVAFIIPANGTSDGAAACTAELLWWRFCATIGPLMGPDGWPKEVGASGCIGEAAGALRCLRWYTLCPFDKHADALRVVRDRMHGQFQNMRMTAIHEGDAFAAAREIVWKWGDAKRLILSKETVQLIRDEADEYAGTGPQPLTRALGAVLQGYMSAPWRAEKDQDW